MCSLCRLPAAEKPQFWANFDFFGSSCTDPLLPMRQNVVCYSRPTVYAYVSNFVSIGLFSVTLCWRKTPIFAVFWTSAFSVVVSWQQSDKVEHGCTTTNLPLSNGIKTVSVSLLQRRHGEIGRTISDVQKRDEQTDKQTKNSTFWPPGRRVESEPHQTWHGDRAPLKLSGV